MQSGSAAPRVSLRSQLASRVTPSGRAGAAGFFGAGRGGIAARTGDAAAIDSKRVETIRATLADGSYRIDPAGIADRMLALDAQIGGTTATGKA